VDKGVMSGGHDPERLNLNPFSRLKRWIILSINGWPDNFPHYFTAFFTFLLGVFTFFAWIETRKGTQAIEGQLAVMRTEENAIHLDNRRSSTSVIPTQRSASYLEL
jgi:hypothetical protein